MRSHAPAVWTPPLPAAIGRWAALLLLIASVPASAVGSAVVLHETSAPAADAFAAAVAFTPVLLGYLAGPRAWPGDEARWPGAVRAAVACLAIWIAGTVAAATLYIPAICGSQIVGPALLAGAVAYAVVAFATIRDGDLAVAGWPAAVVAGLVVAAVVIAAGPHGVCTT